MMTLKMKTSTAWQVLRIPQQDLPTPASRNPVAYRQLLDVHYSKNVNNHSRRSPPERNVVQEHRFGFQRCGSAGLYPCLLGLIPCCILISASMGGMGGFYRALACGMSSNDASPDDEHDGTTPRGIQSPTLRSAWGANEHYECASQAGSSSTPAGSPDKAKNLRGHDSGQRSRGRNEKV